MKVVWIGGMTRSAEQYEREAARFGHHLEAHDGTVGGRGSGTLRTAIQRADLVIALTEVNSHGAVGIARKEARELDKPFVLLRRCGLSRFRALLESLAGSETRERRRVA